jgi:hypothetical protein
VSSMIDRERVCETTNNANRYRNRRYGAAPPTIEELPPRIMRTILTSCA